ncbi:MAG: 50S ribosomal protein L21 [Microthrixaceae bacterium]|nr:50S ribosomal protein L21 [Microthrixaceae bacterium]
MHVTEEATHIAVLEGRSLVEHYVARPSDDVYQIHGNIYVGRVENVLPGMEAAFVDIATPKNAVLYRSDVTWDPDDHEGLPKGEQPKIEDVLTDRQMILCQVTKNPIAHKGARLTQEVSIPGRFVVFVPNSNTVGISKRLPDKERKRLRKILDRARPEGHGLIVRTAAEGVTAEEIQRDVRHLAIQWNEIAQMAHGQNSPRLIYREPNMAVRMIREEFNADFRSVLIDDPELHAEIRSYAETVAPALADRVALYDTTTDPLPMFERYHVSEQVAKALDRKVWLPSGGSLIIESTEALTVVDVNTGKNVGSSSLEETVLDNNLEAAEEIAHQLRLRDIGGIIVIDFVDMELKANRDQVVRRLKESLARDKTRTQVFPISELGLVEMTRKRIGEGLLESVAARCDNCDGRGLNVPEDLLRGSIFGRMYAVVKTGGKQYRVEQGQRLRVERVGAPDAELELTPVMVVDGDRVVVGPDAAAAKVSAKVLEEGRGPKIHGFTYKNKSNQRRRWGHRQAYSMIEITGISAG